MPEDGGIYHLCLEVRVVARTGQLLFLMSYSNMFLPASDVNVNCTAGTVVESGDSFLMADRTVHV